MQKQGRIYRDKALERILLEDFEEFIKYKGVNSNETIRNNWSHINSLLATFKDKGKIGYNPFGSGRTACLGDHKNEKIKNQNNLTESNVCKIIKFYASKDNAARNIAGFLLCAVMGFERSDVIEMRWDCIDLKAGIVHHGKRNLKCPKLLLDCFMVMSKDKAKSKNKLSNVFCTCKAKKFYPFSVVTLNDIFNRLENIDKSDVMWKMYSPKYVKNCSIQVYFEQGYSVDEVLYWTGCDFGQVAEVLSLDDIYKRVEKTRKENIAEGLFGGLLNTCLEDWK